MKIKPRASGQPDREVPSVSSEESGLHKAASAALILLLSVVQAVCLCAVLLAALVYFAGSLTFLSPQALSGREGQLLSTGALYLMIFGGVLTAAITVVIFRLSRACPGRYFLSAGLSLLAGGLACFPMVLFARPQGPAALTGAGTLLAGSILLLLCSCMWERGRKKGGAGGGS